MLFASIPSPPDNVIEIGPLTVHYYGILIGIGVALAVIITSRRYAKFGGDSAMLDRALLWVARAFDAGVAPSYFKGQPPLRDLIADDRYQQLAEERGDRP